MGSCATWLQLRATLARAHQGHASLCVFCDAYGLSAADQYRLLDLVVERTWRMCNVLINNADREPYASLVRDGHAETWSHATQHVEQNIAVWRRQLPSGL